MLVFRSLFISTTVLILACSVAAADEVASSPKKGWGEFEVVERDTSRPWWKSGLMWFPNRFMDALDIFRVDGGVGGAAGGVVRVTPKGQAGYRKMFPGSARLGYFGRRAPFIVEPEDEIGIGSSFSTSPQRDICAAEVGVGADLLLGLYAGICGEEIIDFAAGLFFIDIQGDDM